MNTGRFKFLPDSQFDIDSDGKKYYFEFGRQRPRDANKFLNVDITKGKDFPLLSDERLNLKYQIGVTPLREIPLHEKDPLLKQK